MPYYHSIKYLPSAMRTRTLAGLGRLRKQLDREMPGKTRSATLVLGTWNIRNFDDNRFLTGFRTKEDFFYIAEIISRFDVIAVQEICDSLAPLEQVMDILGSEYDYIVTDVTEGRAGNKERLGFIFDRSKVQFRGVAGELVLPDNMQIIDGERKRQFSRTPFMCSFQASWFKFMFSTVHIYFGDTSGPNYERRVNEINSVAKFLAKRAKRDAKANNPVNHILVGDFNIVEPGSRGYNVLQKNGFEIYQNQSGSNKDQTRFYDQISFLVQKDELRFAPSDRNKGVFQFFKSIYRPRDFPAYRETMLPVVAQKIRKLETELAREEAKLARADTDAKRQKAKDRIADKKDGIADWTAALTDDDKLKKYYLKDWRTFRASDHLPLWVELEIDFGDSYLASLAAAPE